MFGRIQRVPPPPALFNDQFTSISRNASGAGALRQSRNGSIQARQRRLTVPDCRCRHAAPLYVNAAIRMRCASRTSRTWTLEPAHTLLQLLYTRTSFWKKKCDNLRAFGRNLASWGLKVLYIVGLGDSLAKTRRLWQSFIDQIIASLRFFI